ERRLRHMHGVNNMVKLDCRRLVENGGRADPASFDPVADRRSKHLAAVPDGLQFPIFARSQSDRLKCRCAMTGAAEHLVAREFQFHRATYNFCRHCSENRMWPHRAFTAECTSNEGTNHAHVFTRKSERVRDDTLRAFYVLGGVINR